MKRKECNMLKYNKLHKTVISIITLWVFLFNVVCGDMVWANSNDVYHLRPPALRENATIKEKQNNESQIIYNQEFVNVISEFLRSSLENNLLSPIEKTYFHKPIGEKSIPIRPSLVYKMARMIERNKVDLDDLTPELQTLLINIILADNMVDFFKEVGDSYREPTKKEQRVVNEAVDIVKSYCTKYELPFEDFSNNVLFYNSLTNRKKGLMDHYTNLISIPDNLSKDDMLKIIIHEGFHYIAGGFPIRWFDEGMTEYLSIMAYIERFGTEFGDDLFERTNENFIGRLFSGHAKQGGIASKCMFNKLINGLSYGNLPEVLLVEYMLLRKEISLKEILHAYMTGNWPLIMKQFGIKTITKLEMLDDIYNGELFKKEDPLLYNAYFFVNMGKKILFNETEDNSSDNIKSTEIEETNRIKQKRFINFDWIKTNFSKLKRKIFKNVKQIDMSI